MTIISCSLPFHKTILKVRILFVDLKANLMFANTIFFIANYDIIAQRLFLFCLYFKISNSALVYLLNKGMSGSRIFFFNFKFASQTAIMLIEWNKFCSRGFAHNYSELFIGIWVSCIALSITKIYTWQLTNFDSQ